MPGLFVDAYGLCICIYKFYNSYISLILLQPVYVCKDELSIYVFMYLFFTVFAPWSVRFRSLVVTKIYKTMDVTGFFFFFNLIFQAVLIWIHSPHKV